MHLGIPTKQVTQSWQTASCCTLAWRLQAHLAPDSVLAYWKDQGPWHGERQSSKQMIQAWLGGSPKKVNLHMRLVFFWTLAWRQQSHQTDDSGLANSFVVYWTCHGDSKPTKQITQFWFGGRSRDLGGRSRDLGGNKRELQLCMWLAVWQAHQTDDPVSAKHR